MGEKKFNFVKKKLNFVGDHCRVGMTFIRPRNDFPHYWQPAKANTIDLHCFLDYGGTINKGKRSHQCQRV
jgi:hypothetical protein